MLHLRLQQYRNLLYGNLRERARLTKPRAGIGYQSGQDGTVLAACDYPFCSCNKISPNSNCVHESAVTFAYNGLPFQWLKINKYEDHSVHKDIIEIVKGNLPNIQPPWPTSGRVVNSVFSSGQLQCNYKLGFMSRPCKIYSGKRTAGKICRFPFAAEIHD